MKHLPLFAMLTLALAPLSAARAQTYTVTTLSTYPNAAFVQGTDGSTQVGFLNDQFYSFAALW